MAEFASTVRDEFRDFALRMADAFARFPELRAEEEELRRLAFAIYEPFTLAVFGYMKTGKSSLINALVGKPLAITGTDETTATLNWISHGTREQEETFLVNWKDGGNEPLPIERLKDWTGKSKEALALCARTARIDLYANTKQLKQIRVVDTPGTGSVSAEHSKAASEILSDEEGRKADALLYVFSAVGKASDEEALEEFRKTCCTGSDPFNSIGVLHLWDNLKVDDPYTEAKRKAGELHSRLSCFVSNVIPVSAPLGLVAQNAPNDFLQGLVDLVSAKEEWDKLEELLGKREERWDADEERRRIRSSFEHIPWASFVRIVRLLIRHECKSVEMARRICLEESGIPLLKSELDRRFFRATAVIKQRLARARVKPLIDKGMMFLNRRHEDLKSDLSHFEDLLRITGKEGIHSRWLGLKISEMDRARKAHDEFAEETSRFQLIEEERMDLMEMDLSFLDTLNRQPDIVQAEDVDQIRCMLGDDLSETGLAAVSAKHLEAMKSRYKHELQGGDKRRRKLFEHLIRHIQERIWAI